MNLRDEVRAEITRLNGYLPTTTEMLADAVLNVVRAKLSAKLSLAESALTHAAAIGIEGSRYHVGRDALREVMALLRGDEQAAPPVSVDYWPKHWYCDCGATLLPHERQSGTCCACYAKRAREAGGL